MLELARDDDRPAVNAMARQVHAMHVAWRPDLYEMIPEFYPEERFFQAVEEKQLYVAKINGIVVGYTKPSASKPLELWKDLIASAVAGPKSPSAATS